MGTDLILRPEPVLHVGSDTFMRPDPTVHHRVAGAVRQMANQFNHRVSLRDRTRMLTTIHQRVIEAAKSGHYMIKVGLESPTTLIIGRTYRDRTGYRTYRIIEALAETNLKYELGYRFVGEMVGDVMTMDGGDKEYFTETGVRFLNSDTHQFDLVESVAITDELYADLTSLGYQVARNADHFMVSWAEPK